VKNQLLRRTSCCPLHQTGDAYDVFHDYSITRPKACAIHITNNLDHDS